MKITKAMPLASRVATTLRALISLRSLKAEEGEQGDEEESGACAEVADVKADKDGGEEERKRARPVGLTGGGAGLVPASERAGDGAADGEGGGGAEEQPRDQMQEGSLGGVEQDDRAGGSAEQAGEGHGPGQAEVVAELGAIGGDGGELSGPDGDGVGGVGLDGRDVHAEEGGKGKEGSSTGHGVEDAGEKGSHDEPDPVPVDGWGEMHWDIVGERVAFCGCAWGFSCKQLILKL